MKAFLMQFIPGQKALAAILVPLMVGIDHALHLGISDGKVAAAAVPLAAYIVMHFAKGNTNA